MKKIISLVLVIMMLSALAVVPASAAVASSVTVEALYFAKAPTFDGVITEEEWGKPTISVNSTGAAEKDSMAPSKLNTFIGIDTAYDESVKAISFDLYLRWDINNLYVGVVVNDVDDYCLLKGKADIWNGDTFQMKVDPYGPNGREKMKNESYDYTKDDVTFKNKDEVWSSKKLINAGFGKVGDNLEAYDMDGRADLLKSDAKFGFTTVADGNGGSVNTYEIAVPWTVIDVTDYANIATNTIIGFSCSVLEASAEKNNGNYLGYINWGAGVCGQPEVTVGGSNAVKLVDNNALNPTAKVEGVPQGNGDPKPKPPSVVYGDVDGDGDVDTDDIILLVQNQAGWESAKNIGAGADANGDGKVDTDDVILLVQNQAGWASAVLGPQK